MTTTNQTKAMNESQERKLDACIHRLFFLVLSATSSCGLAGYAAPEGAVGPANPAGPAPVGAAGPAGWLCSTCFYLLR